MRLLIGIFLAALAAPLSAQFRLRLPTEDEQRAVQQAIRDLALAANRRDAAGVKLASPGSLNVRVAGRLFDVNGVAQGSERRDEDLSMVQVASLVRDVRLFAEDTALVGGYFRTMGWPGGEFAGDFWGVLVKREGRWLVSQVRCDPHLGDAMYFAVTPAPGKETGWIDLLAGGRLDAFTSFSGAAPKTWSVEDGVLTVAGSEGGSIRTKETFRSFEAEWEWKVPAKGNSGIKYRIFYLLRGDAAAYEYQLVDDGGDKGAIANATERSGALYNQIAPSKAVVKPVGEYNRSRLVVRGRHCEHWLNGEKVVEFETESDPLESPLLVQNHGTRVWIRGLRVRRLAEE